MSLADFPDDVQLCVLSFLSPGDVSSFASASKRCVSLCRRSESRLWFAMCERRWGSKTRVAGWGGGGISYRLLYRTLSGWDHLIGFWRRSGGDDDGDRSPPLVFFEWGPHFVSGSRVSPARDGSYAVAKSPFLRLSLSPDGQVQSFLDPAGEMVPASVSLVGRNHFIVEEEEEENPSSGGVRRSSSSKDLGGEDEDDDVDSDFGSSPGSLPDRFVSEVYQHLANRTSPVGDRAARRQRRREKERRRARRMKWDPQHFVKIVHCSPTLSRPLQGLWKGICEDMNLGIYLIAYDDIGCITCRKVWDSPENNSGHNQLFWISDTSFHESPFPLEEQALYRTRVHLRPIPDSDLVLESLSLDEQSSKVSRILCLNSNFDATSPRARFLEGRLWQYEDGTFGFGFLGDNFIVDLKNVSENGCLLDAAEFSGD